MFYLEQIQVYKDDLFPDEGKVPPNGDRAPESPKCGKFLKIIPWIYSKFDNHSLSDTKHMKGKRIFTSAEIEAIERLINRKVVASKEEQKKIRDEIRDVYEFYFSDFSSKKGYTVQDLQGLIDSGEITVSDSSTPAIRKTEKREVIKRLKDESIGRDTVNHTYNLDSSLKSFRQNLFDPMVDPESKIPDKAGNYIICLKEGSRLPSISVIPEFTKFENLDVIYTGIASSSLKSRDYRQHFKGNNAGRSTLRKSLGVLFGYKKIPRDSDPNTGKTKFPDVDESKLSEWMVKNLIMFFLPNKDHDNLELDLINHFNPPLNLKENHGWTNMEFRRLLSSLRGKSE